MLTACAALTVASSAHAAKSKKPEEPLTPQMLHILGTDVDENGIRDDVQMYLMQSYSNQPHLFKSFVRLATIDQTLHRHAFDEKQNAKHYREWSIAMACLARSTHNPHHMQGAMMMYDRVVYNSMPRVEVHQILENYQMDYVQNTSTVRCDAK